MKRLSLVAIAAIAALSLTAAIGSATASATVLCKTHWYYQCPTSDVLPAGTWLTYGTRPDYTTTKENLTLTPSGGSSGVYTCDQVLLGEETTAERGSPLPANGGRDISSCKRSGWGNCTMSMSNSSDQLTSFEVTGGFVKTGPLTFSANCSESPYKIVCNWTGSYEAAAAFAKNEAGENGWFEWITSGGFTFTSGSVNGKSSELGMSAKWYCGGENASLKTKYLEPATEAYIES